MKKIAMILSFIMCMVAAALAQDRTVDLLMQKSFPDLPGREGVMLVVNYPPGDSSPQHRHNAHTFVYVLEGTIVMQVEGGEKMTLSPGGTFYETPDDIHAVSMNASDTKPAKILVFFVKKEGDPITVPVH